MFIFRPVEAEIILLNEPYLQVLSGELSKLNRCALTEFGTCAVHGTVQHERAKRC